MKKHKKAFLKHDPEGFTKYLEEVKEGKKRIASGALLPHEIMMQLFEVHSKTTNERKPQLDLVAELQWKDYVENFKKSGELESAFAVCDLSTASMKGETMLVAVALSLLIAAGSKPPFDRYTFQRTLSWLNFSST